jgi:hypothetical protein
VSGATPVDEFEKPTTAGLQAGDGRFVVNEAFT